MRNGTAAPLAIAAFVGMALVSACNRTPGGTSGSQPAPASVAAPAALKPEGASEFKASQQAFQKVQHLTVEHVTTTDIGVFTEVMEADCASPYYHSRSTKDLSPRGIETNATQVQGRPRAHQEGERLFVEGRSFDRYSGSWENPAAGTDDADPNWGPAINSYDPTADCESFHQARAIPFVPFDKILAANKIEYQADRTADGVQCHEYTVTYSDLVDSDQTTTIDTGGGSSTTYRKQVDKPVQSTICLGVGDFLPRQGSKDNVTFKFSYAPIEKLGTPR